MNALTRFTAMTLLAASTSASAQPPATWVASWQASPQPVWDATFLFPTLIPAALEGQTFRQTARLSLGGDQLRVRLSNAYGTAPLQIGAASVAGADGQAPLPLTFDGRAGTQIAPGQARLSDPVLLPTRDRRPCRSASTFPRIPRCARSIGTAGKPHRSGPATRLWRRKWIRHPPPPRACS